MKVCLGYLFKKIANYGKKEGQYNKILLEFEGLVCGESFVNQDGEEFFHIISGKYEDSNFYSVFNKKFNEKEENFVKPLENYELNNLLAMNNNSANFKSLQEKCLKEVHKYWSLHYLETRNFLNKEEGLAVDQLIEKYNAKKLATKTNNKIACESDISKMYNAIKKTIIAQDNQIKSILAAIYKNQELAKSKLPNDKINELKESILLYGPTGTGKTKMLTLIANLFKIPIVIEDVTTITEAGYVGRNINDMFEGLVAQAGNKIYDAECGILVLDEFDKLAERNSDDNTHVSREGVQRGLLKVLDGSKVVLSNKKTFDCSKLTIVASGAFTDIIKQEKSNSIGFGDINNNQIDVNNYKNVSYDDFTKFGITRELLGRFSKLVAMNPLKKEDLKRIILESDSSPLVLNKEYYNLRGIKLSYSDDFIDWYAEEAIKRNSGARSLKAIFDECMSMALYEIHNDDVTKLTLKRPEQIGDPVYKISRKRKK